MSSREQELSGYALWKPTVGEEASELIRHLNLNEDGAEQVKGEALRILSACLPPHARRARRTGLVIGYIQSGKTMSFTTLAALARDNGYRLIIVLSGMQVPLFRQSSDRLEEDLRVNERDDKVWRVLRNPRNRNDNSQTLSSALKLKRPLIGIIQKTVLITVMKNGAHLDNLTALLQTVDLTEVPAIVIDDEGDQASLNNSVRRGLLSATYRRVLALRDALPQHTFLQFTATPQALLLISIADLLSPEFVELLTPGQAYVGGREFFEANLDLVRRIPASDLPSNSNVLLEPPESLLESLRQFTIAAAMGFRSGSRGNRSMMVHPSREVAQHANYLAWIFTIIRNWSKILDLEVESIDREELLEEFHSSYTDLTRTCIDLLPFEELLPYIAHALQDTLIMEFNAARPRDPQFKQEYSHIMVGGDKLNRGYTVEGLTTTYMPRGSGIGNADTIQQRARWFGYKASYLGLCRVFLSDASISDYCSYVEHEQSVRNQLQKVSNSGTPLGEWQRAFLLSPQLRPTRDSVLARPFLRGVFADGWFDPRSPQAAPASNRIVVDELCALCSSSFAEDVGHAKRTVSQRHLVSDGLSLRQVCEEYLSRIRWSDIVDSRRYVGLLVQLMGYLDMNGDFACSVYLMSKGNPRIRSVDDSGHIRELFQGANPGFGSSRGSYGEFYPGDSKIRARGAVTVQVHNIDVRRDKKLVAANVPLVAVYVPSILRKHWIAC